MPRISITTLLDEEAEMFPVTDSLRNLVWVFSMLLFRHPDDTDTREES